MYVDVVLAGIEVFADRPEVTLWVRAADDVLLDRLLVDQLGGLFEVRGDWQLEEVAAADRSTDSATERCRSGRRRL